MSYFCEVVDCDNDAEYWDDMDNRICHDHFIQDMDETGKFPEDYQPISKEEFTDEGELWPDSKPT